MPALKLKLVSGPILLYFTKHTVKKIVTGIAVVQPALHLAAGEAHCEVLAETEPLPADVHVMGISPHMHNLGKEFKVVAVDPSGKKTAPLIWIKDWDFNWQGAYQFAKPLRLPKGSKIKVQAIYDNSAANTKNPNSPPKEIFWGEQTSDEMCLCSVQVFTDTPSDLRKVAGMFGNELGAGLDGGVPGQAAVAKRKAGNDKQSARQQARAGKGAPRPPAAADAPPAPASDAAAAKPAAAKPAAPAAKPVADIPEGGLPIPENARKIFSKFDPDNNGILSRQEFEQMPPNARDIVLRSLKNPPKPPQ